MSNFHSKFNRILGCLSLILLTTSIPANAYSYVQSPYENIDYYELGMNSIENREFTKAIDYLKKALNKDPQNPYIRNNLAVALTSRGTYLYNQKIDLEKAANDYRSAIFYLQHYGKSQNTDTINENINIAHQNLTSVLKSANISTDAANRLKKAKELRGKGELAAAFVEYNYAAKERKYAYESYVALGDIMTIFSDEYNAAVYYDKALALNSNEAYLHLKFGRTLYKLGKYDTAVRELDLATENSKTKIEALALLETIWKNITLKNSQDAIAQMNLGAIYQKQGKFNQALSQYQLAQKLDNNNPMIKLNIATLYQQKGDFSEALAIYNNALKSSPSDITLNCYKAATLNQMGKQDEAINIYQKLLIQNPENAKIKKELLKTINSSSDIIATNYLENLSKNMPNDADIQYNYAYLLHKNHHYKDALPYYQKALQLDAQNIDAYLNIASIYKQQNNIELALQTLEQAKNIFPDNSKVAQSIKEIAEEKSFSLLQKATKLYQEKQYNEAINTYKSISNPSEDVYLGIGACYQALENYDNAILYYNKAIQLDPSNPTSHYFLGIAYLYQKNFDKSEIALKKAMELDSINPDIKDAYKTLKFSKSEQIMNEGISLFESDMLEKAVAKFNNAIELCNENGYAHYYRGLALDMLKRSEKAIEDYKLAIELNPELTIIYYSMAVAYDNLDNRLEAKKMYQKFIEETKTDDEYSQYAKQRLSEL